MKLLQAVKLLTILTGTVVLTACSTVDLSQMAIEKPVRTAKIQQKSVVERASVKMVSLFENKKWCEARSQSKNRAASILMNGISKIKDFRGYRAQTQQILKTDIRAANASVKQTTKAAEIFLAMVDNNAELDNEIRHLELALMAAKQATQRFTREAKRHNVYVANTDISNFVANVDDLQAVTDEFGKRIREFMSASAQPNRS